MEKIRIPISGSLDYDNDNLSKQTGDGFERENIKHRRDGVCVLSDGLESLLTGDHTIAASCEGDNQLYIIANKKNIQYLYSYDGTLNTLYRSETKLVHGDEAPMVYSDGYLFITEQGQSQLMLNISELTAIGNLNSYFLLGAIYTEPGQVYVHTLNMGLDVGDTLYIYSSPRKVIDPAQFGINGGVTITRVETSGLYGNYYFTIPWSSYDFSLTTVYLSTGKRTQCPYILSSITLAHPVPLVPPTISMRHDDSLGMNVFLDNIYSFGYSYVYEDGYETPISPMTLPDLSALQAQISGDDYNVVDIYIKTYLGVKKVNIYTKRNSSDSAFFLIAEKDAQPVVTYTFDGVLSGQVVSNSIWVKEAESIPQSSGGCKVYDNKLLLYNNTEGLENTGITYFRATTDVSFNEVHGASETNKTWGKSIQDEHTMKLTFPSFTSFDPTYQSGSFLYSITIKCIGLSNANGAFYQYGVLSVSGKVYFDNEAIDSVVDKIIGDINLKSPGIPFYGVDNDKYYSTKSFGEIISSITRSGNDIIIVLKNYFDFSLLLFSSASPYFSTKYMASVALSSYTYGTAIFSRTMKPYVNNEYGVVYFDEQGRTAGVYTSGDNTEVDYVYYEQNKIQVVKPKFYITGKPDWAVAYQYVKKLKYYDYKQVFVPAQYTVTQTDSNDGIIIFSDGTYGVAINMLVTADNVSNLSNYYYEYRAGDYIKLIRLIESDGTFTNLGPTTEGVFEGYVPKDYEKWYRINGYKVDDNGTGYFIIEGDYSSVYSHYSTSTMSYIQFEIANFGVNNELNDLWIEIGERKVIYESEVYGEIINYGDAIVRNVYGAYIESTYNNISYLYSESPYLSDSSKDKKIFDPDRPQVTLKGQLQKNTIRWSNTYLEDTDTNGFCVFESTDVKEYEDDKGGLVSIEKDGNRLYVFSPRALYLTNINTKEVTYANGETSAIYSDDYIGNHTSIDYGTKDMYSVVKGKDIYFYDNFKNNVYQISNMGIINITGWQKYSNGAALGKVSTFFNDAEKVVCGYDKGNDYLYITKLNSGEEGETLIYDAISNTFVTKNQLHVDRYLYLDRLYMVGNVNIYKYGTGNNVLTSTGLGSGYSYYDTILNAGEDVDLLSLVFYGENIFENPVELYVYGADGSQISYSKIYKRMAKKYGEAYYADVPKGALTGEAFKSYMMYNGSDLTGLLLRIKFTLTSTFKLYGVEVRYEKRNY